MPENPLAGISIPSLCDIAERTVDMMGLGEIDLSNPLQRRRLIGAIEQCLNHAMTFELERAIETATERSVKHVFRVMRDSDYQEKKRQSRDRRRKQKSAERDIKKNAEKEARMDYSRRAIGVSKTTIQ